MRISDILHGMVRWLAALGAAALIVACAQPSVQAPVQPRERTHATKPTFVSLNPCLDALLVELADDDQILALSHFSRDPASSSIPQAIAKQFAVTGGTAEEVLALDPDIVLASDFMAPATRAAFERLGVQVETFGSPASVAASYRQIDRVAALTGHEQRARDLTGRIGRSLTRASAERHEHGDVEALLWQSGQIVAGKGALVTNVLENAGFVRRANTMSLGQGDYVSLESLVADPPDLILVAGSSVGQRHRALEALEDTQVAALDPSLFYCGGPSLIALDDRLEKLRASMQGGAQ